MNCTILSGRLTADPEVRTTQNGTVMVNFTLAVERRFKRDGEPTADFIRCVAFGKSAEFFERYVSKGKKMIIRGRIQTGSYTNRDGQKVYTTDVIVEDQEFAESKAASAEATEVPRMEAPDEDGFMDVPQGIEEELPFM